MATFYYYPQAMLHLCNSSLSCSEENYAKLSAKGKIGEDRLNLLFLLQKYRAMTLDMITLLTGQQPDFLHNELDTLMEYGLVIKQFYEAKVEGEKVRTHTFYCVSEPLPAAAVCQDKKNDFIWNKELFIGDAMAILSFNQFHLSLINSTPHKALQAQTQYHIAEEIADGRYKLKGKKFQLGYSHVIVFSVRDFAGHNVKIIERLQKIGSHYSYAKEKMPWFILVCENKIQCCNINRKIKMNPETKDFSVFFLLDTDLAYDENPLQILQTYRFVNKEREILSETFHIDPWY